MNKIILLLFIIITYTYSQDFPIRIYHTDDEDNLARFTQICERVSKAGYTHITYDPPMVENDWDTATGLYGAGTEMVEDLKNHWQVAYNKGLKLIPLCPGPNQWNGNFYVQSGNTIHFQPLIKQDIAEETTEELKIKIVLVKIIEKIVGLFGYGLEGGGIKIEVSNVPSLAPDSTGVDKVFKSLIERCYLRAWNEFSVSISDPSYQCDIIHIGIDEMLTYEALVPRNRKLLAGKCQKDLEWMYNLDTTTHCGIEKRNRGPYNVDSLLLDSLSNIIVDSNTSVNIQLLKDHFSNESNENFLIESLVKYQEGLHFNMDAETNEPEDLLKTLYFFDDCYYTVENYDDPNYLRGVRQLIADQIRRRVQDVVDAFPEVDVSIYSDMLDPEHVGGYLKTDSAVIHLKDMDVMVSGASVNLTDILILTPWQYQNTFLHDAEFTVKHSELNDEVSAPVTKLTTAYAACNTLPFPANRVCKRKVKKWKVIKTVSTLCTINEITFNSTGKYYDVANTSQFFIDNGFRHIFVHAFEKDEMYGSGVVASKKFSDYCHSLSDSIKNEFIPGFFSASWGKNERRNTIWDTGKDIYDQPKRFNIIEYISTLYLDHDSFTGMLFSKTVENDSGDVLIDSLQVSCVDYLSESGTTFGLYDTANNPELKATYFHRLLMLNRMSKRYGLDTVYTYSSIESFPYGTKGDRAYYNNKLWLNNLDADYSKNGFRLPTLEELRASNLNYEHEGEYIWDSTHTYNQNGEYQYYPVYVHSLDTVTLLYEQPDEYPYSFGNIAFRVARNLPDSVTLSNMVISGKGKFVAGSTIQIQDVGLSSNADVEMISNEIRILPEFHAPSGSRLHLKLK